QVEKKRPKLDTFGGKTDLVAGEDVKWPLKVYEGINKAEKIANILGIKPGGIFGDGVFYRTSLGKYHLNLKGLIARVETMLAVAGEMGTLSSFQNKLQNKYIDPLYLISEDIGLHGLNYPTSVYKARLYLKPRGIKILEANVGRNFAGILRKSRRENDFKTLPYLRANCLKDVFAAYRIPLYLEKRKARGSKSLSPVLLNAYVFNPPVSYRGKVRINDLFPANYNHKVYLIPKSVLINRAAANDRSILRPEEYITLFPSGNGYKTLTGQKYNTLNSGDVIFMK
ncbi:hypothetical protein KKG71_06055, partial [Patescibacteria group bacterium]|nr:hypothetical protein [Patescibacteria group bacterium]